MPAADPADPARCHLEDGEAVSVTTAQMLTCTAALSWMLHGRDGAILDLGRKRRRPGKAQRKAARDRDRGRCCYPGCESRTADLHHIQYRASGGRTDLANLIGLCRRHHMVVHDRGYLITAGHDAGITPDTIIPPWYGERLDLDYAIRTCLANEKTRADRAAGRDRPGPGGDPDGPPGVSVFAPGDWYPLLLEFNAEVPGSWKTSRISFPEWLYQRTKAAA